mgnify:CR=1 FL=1
MSGPSTAATFDTQLFDGASMSLADGLRHLRLSGRWRADLVWLARLVAIPAMAKDLGLAASDAELQAAVDEFRRGNDLLDASAARKWLDEHGFTLEQLEEHLEVRVLAHKLKDRIRSGPRVDAYVRDNPSAFQKAPDAEAKEQVVGVLLEQDLVAYLEKRGIREAPIRA